MDKYFNYKPYNNGLHLEVCSIYDHSFEHDTLVIPTQYNEKNIIALKVFFLVNNVINKLTLPKFTETIELINFTNCSNIKELAFPQNLTTIENVIFADCVSLTQFTLPENIEKISSITLKNCPFIERITTLNSNVDASEIVIENCDALVEVSLCLWQALSLETQTKLAKIKFNNWIQLTIIEKAEIIDFLHYNQTLVNSILKSDCFKAIPILINESFHLSLANIDYFLDLSINAQNTSISAVLLDYRNENFTELEIQKYNKQKEEFEYGFELPTLEQLEYLWHINLIEDEIYITGYKGTDTDVVIPAGVIEGNKITGIDFCDGHNFTPIQNLTIQANINYLGDYAFYKCHTLRKVIFEENSIDFISDNCFFECHSLQEIDLPDGITTICRNAFYDCVNLTKINFPFTLNTIMKSAFRSCNSLENLTFPAQLKIIGNNAFEYCSNLKTAEFNSFIEYEENVFSFCESVQFLHNY